MFNFFDEIKKGIDAIEPTLNSYNLVNISGKLLYVEGHKGLTLLSKDIISFKIKGGRINVEGKDLVLNELTENTMKIVGQIIKVEVQ